VSANPNEDLAQARRLPDEAEDRLAGLATSEKVQAYLMISGARVEIARIQGQLNLAGQP